MKISKVILKNILICFFSFILLFSYSDNIKGFKVEAASSVKISDTKLSLENGKEKTLKVKGAKVKKWSSSNKNIAVVSSKGVITAKKTGTCTITAKTSKKTLTCKLQVVPPVEDAIKSIEAMQSKYPEGTKWNSSNTYTFTHLKGQTLKVNECQAFAFMMSDAAYGSLPAYVSYDFGKIKTGDVIFILAGSTLSDGTSTSGPHAVCVQSVDYDNDELIVCEGNYGGKVHWNAKLTISEMSLYAGQVIITRYLNPSGGSNPAKPGGESITKTADKDGYKYVYCKKLGKKCTGYQFLLSESSSFPWKSTAVYYRSKENNYLYGDTGGTYYIKVRAFNHSGGRITYGKWSKVKKVKL